MDSFELFRKLGAGAKFDLKRFGQDAARFKVNCQFPAASSIKNIKLNTQLKADKCGLTLISASLKFDVAFAFGSN